MNLPKKWSVLEIPTELDPHNKYLFGVDYSKTSYHYSLYLTDLTNVWISDADESKLQLKALQNGIQVDSLPSIYQTLIISFENNFNGADTETHIDLAKLKIDRGVPLELKLDLIKVYDSVKLNWNFDLTIIPDSSAISILKNLIFHLSTVVFSLNEYKNDLVKQIEHKDSAIRYLTESIEGMDAGHIIKKWAPDNSMNSRTLKDFDSESFDKVWKERKQVQLENQYIWDLLELNTSNNTWSYGTDFKQDIPVKPKPTIKDRKRSLDSDFKDEDEDDEVVQAKPEEHKRSQSPVKRRKVTSLQRLTTDFEDYDLKKESPVSSNPQSKEASRSPTRSPSVSVPPSSPAKTDTQGESAQNTQGSKEEPQKKKRSGFGVSRKRKVAYNSFSPIKSAKHFNSDD